MKKSNTRAFRVVAWVCWAALFCFGLVVMVALGFLVVVLTPVILLAISYPRAQRGRGAIRATGDTGGAPETLGAV